MECKEAIIRYETARQLVSNLKKKRSAMIGECKSIKTVDDPTGFGKIETGVLCLRAVFDELMEIIDLNGGGYSYEEVIGNMHYDKKCCDSCFESYKIKTGPLSEAKKEFGEAKRALSRMGKKLTTLDNKGE